jgi:hypothetical protein
MTANLPEENGEACARCGEVGEDRRTLWMACFYDMAELRVPFEQRQIMGVSTRQTGSVSSHGWDRPVFAEQPADAKPHSNKFYTLRVCKDCRGDWMGAIAEWFQNPPARESCGSGIFVRENGATVEITEEEWQRRNPGQEPVRFNP